MANKKQSPEFVRLKIDFISVDRTQYKPYFSQLSGLDNQLFVDVPVSEAGIAEVMSDGGMVLTLEGLAGIMVKVADSITSADEEARRKKFGH